ncbi:tetraspanin Pls1 family [Atractiella rhizophila]|nr:tetraspanin Pls1 family [Atractiella rhizophila]
MSGKGGLNSMTLRRLVISDSDLLSGVVLGAFYLVSWVLSIPAFIVSKRDDGRRPNTKLLFVLNWSLIFAAFATLAIGTAIWFFTLRERQAFHNVWNEQDQLTQAFLQDTLKCCGYFNATSQGSFSVATGFCANVANVTANPCVTPITNFADYTLNNIFTTIYGFIAVVLSLLLCSLCVINDRNEELRFRLIDEKQGRGGFV